jgi:tetratricopeptide (TPR) repeat protein
VLEGIALLNLADLLRARQQPAEAEQLLRESIPILEAAVGPGHMYVAVARYGLAESLAKQGRTAESVLEYRAALGIMLEAVPADHPDAADIKRGLALALLAVGLDDAARRDEATKLVQEAWERHRQDDVPAARRAWTQFALARVQAEVASGAQARRSAIDHARAAAALLDDAGATDSTERREITAWLRER